MGQRRPLAGTKKKVDVIRGFPLSGSDVNRGVLYIDRYLGRSFKNETNVE